MGVEHNKDIEGVFQTYYCNRISRTVITQTITQYGSDLLVDFDLTLTNYSFDSTFFPSNGTVFNDSHIQGVRM